MHDLLKNCTRNEGKHELTLPPKRFLRGLVMLGALALLVRGSAYTRGIGTCAKRLAVAGLTNL